MVSRPPNNWGHQLPEGAQSRPGPFPDLRDECADRGVEVGHVTDLALGYVMEALNGDVALAADALEMNPRAMWVEEFVGCHVGSPDSDD